MLNTLIIGFGRAGAGLHWPALRKMMQAPLAGRGATTDLPRVGRVFVFDSRIAQVGHDVPNEVVILHDYESIAATVDPRDTVVHVCTPPLGRSGTVEQLAAAGFRRFLLEKPLADTYAEIAALDAIRERYALDLLVMGNFIVSAVTERIAALTAGGAHGRIRRLDFVQRKPRFSKSLANRDHPTAFDVEVPHAVGAALMLAGVEAEVIDARCSDLFAFGRRVPQLGTAHLTLLHARDGALTEIRSDLMSPIRERSVEVHLEDGHRIVGHYPVSESDHHAQLAVYHRGGGELYSEVVFDDSILSCMVKAYRYFEGRDERPRSDFALNSAIVRLIADAKLRSGVELALPGLDKSYGGIA